MMFYLNNASLIAKDGTERYDFWSRFSLLHSPFLFAPKKRGKRKGKWSSKNRDQKSYLSVPSLQRYLEQNKSNVHIYVTF